MHWFWRATIAAGVAYLFATLTLPLVRPVVDAAKYLIAWILGVPVSFSGITLEQLAFAWVIPVCIVAVLTFMAMTRWTRLGLSHETRCRKCGYILRGLSEPRCPECGERI